MPTPSRGLVRLPNSGDFDTRDVFGRNNSPRLRNVRCEVLSLVGGTTPAVSAVLPAIGYRAAILGVGMEISSARAADRSLTFQLTSAGDGVGGSDDALGTFATVVPPLRAAAGAAPVSSPKLLSAGITLVSAPGDGITAVWRVSHDLIAGETGAAYVYYWLFDAADLVTCP